MKVLVTGGAGFIGSHVVDALLDKGHEVLVVDNFTSGKKENLNPKAKLFELDVTNKKLSEVFEENSPEAVFHFAAQIDINKSVQDPVWDAEQNILGSVNLLEACRRFGVKKVVFASTAGVYGDTDQIPTTEEAPTLPPSPYGIGKLTTERYLDYYLQTFKLPYVALRYSNVYGPRQISKGEGGVVAIFCNQIISEEQPLIFGEGTQTRDFIYVSDVVKANLLALESDKTGVYNVSTAKETDVNQLAEIIKSNVNVDVNFTHGPARTVDQARSALDYSKAKKDLNFQPEVDLESGIKKTVAWFQGEKRGR